jgi:cell division protease FtsH
LQTSEDTRRRIDEAIRHIVMAGFSAASAILSTNRAVLEHGARALLEKETLDEAAILALAQELHRDDFIAKA